MAHFVGGHIRQHQPERVVLGQARAAQHEISETAQEFGGRAVFCDHIACDDINPFRHRPAARFGTARRPCAHLRGDHRSRGGPDSSGSQVENPVGEVGSDCLGGDGPAVSWCDGRSTPDDGEVALIAQLPVRPPDRGRLYLLGVQPLHQQAGRGQGPACSYVARQDRVTQLMHERPTPLWLTGFAALGSLLDHPQNVGYGTNIGARRIRQCGNEFRIRERGNYRILPGVNTEFDENPVAIGHGCWPGRVQLGRDLIVGATGDDQAEGPELLCAEGYGGAANAGARRPVVGIDIQPSRANGGGHHPGAVADSDPPSEGLHALGHRVLPHGHTAYGGERLGDRAVRQSGGYEEQQGVLVGGHGRSPHGDRRKFGDVQQAAADRLRHHRHTLRDVESPQELGVGAATRSA
ncbi:hypothetical protein B7C42_06054 [Nocardia cerradoensis]|uniref:Uncharacterized protein n=1 Tax=Nocardia cerradoensis TaxID=85688 RepID=A0A231GYQ9_9NOCA|nr:hypothetical protein B7C42_08152 [Nocardia cerradoensis]OXR41712.1 hypothetical protein B7C42_06054 [Nocardia cerradoensis]